VYHWVSNSTRFIPSRRDESLRAELGVDSDGLLLVYAGRLDAERQPDVVLEAVALLRNEIDVHIAMAGDGPLRGRLERRAADIGGTHILPFEPDRHRLARLLASADIYVSAMAHETFGLSVIEAQACGLPVVGVRAGAMVDRVHDGEGFLVPPGSPSALAQCILDTPRDEWHAMGQRARSRVEREFSWNRTFETLLDRYTAALRAARNPLLEAHW
jgi:alpha-1,6-mannosyltransferase